MTVAHDHGDTTQEKNGVPDAHATLEKSSVAPGPLGPTGPDDPTGPRLNVEVGSSSGSWFGGTGFNAGHGSSGEKCCLANAQASDVLQQIHSWLCSVFCVDALCLQ